ncbi:Argonaute complex, subunit Arb1 [Apodospora peruviana]|uniref:Argonaute complex, subunit Arb1 n=1 Tax=Apodospora peruviana TaxID=516989 RepID=A0AAE0M3S8_9PEZI|nr:Argonaute complex, subunit Arb1 [Apodospora peruviana]
MSSSQDSDPAPTAEETVQEPDRTNVHLDLDNAAGKKKSRGGHGKSKKATGFEEFYCDPPLTPDEYDQEKNVIYPVHRPFADRIEECIQRFRARRRLDNIREFLFSKYLFLGGIDTAVRQFQSTRSMTAKSLQDTTKSDVREMTADDVIQRGADKNRDPRFYNPNYPEHWDVDFAGVAAGFFSEQLIALVGTESVDYRQGVDVVYKFLKYVEQHDVCPEYAQDLKKAQEICELALDEVPTISKASMILPGDFNNAARQLFCKVDEFNLVDQTDFQSLEPLDNQKAHLIFGVTLSILLPPSVSVVAKGELTVINTVEQAFEICQISLADDEPRAKYKTINSHLAKSMGISVEVCGSITVHPTHIRNGWDNTTPGANVDDRKKEGKEETFILEESILSHLKVGMKITMTVCTLDVGIKFIKHVKDVNPTFYTFLPQELMLHYKEPVPNDRLGKSIHDDPDADDNEDPLAGVPIGDPEG